MLGMSIVDVYMLLQVARLWWKWKRLQVTTADTCGLIIDPSLGRQHVDWGCVRCPVSGEEGMEGMEEKGLGAETHAGMCFKKRKAVSVSSHACIFQSIQSSIDVSTFRFRERGRTDSSWTRCRTVDK